MSARAVKPHPPDFGGTSTIVEPLAVHSVSTDTQQPPLFKPSTMRAPAINREWEWREWDAGHPMTGKSKPPIITLIARPQHPHWSLQGCRAPGPQGSTVQASASVSRLFLASQITAAAKALINPWGHTLTLKPAQVSTIPTSITIETSLHISPRRLIQMPPRRSWPGLERAHQ